jgi:hypothetical protein
MICRSQWSRDLRNLRSSTARTPGSWVRIPVEAWSVSAFFCVTLSCRSLKTGRSPVKGVLSNVQKHIHKFQKSNSVWEQARGPNPNL